MAIGEWPCPARPVILQPGDIHVWRVALDSDAAGLSLCGRTLASDEWARADRFRMERDRNRYIRARGALRLLLGDCLGAAPESLRFAYGPLGKPALAAPAIPLHFNVSHAGDLALIAVCQGRPVGVDVEQIRLDYGGEAIAERFFSPGERAWLLRLPPSQQTTGFFRLWTRKEAYLKARGEGIWRDLAGFDVSQSPPEPVWPDGAWFLHDLAPAPGYCAAVAVEGPFGPVRTWGYSLASGHGV